MKKTGFEFFICSKVQTTRRAKLSRAFEKEAQATFDRKKFRLKT
jgi:hypothetical protein